MPTAAARRTVAARALVLGVVLALFAFRGVLVLRRNYDPDELQHLHNAYCVTTGVVPYVDYFEHHPPLIAWLLAPVVRLGGEAWTTVQAARGVMLPFAAGILALTYLLGRRAALGEAALLGTLLVSTTVLFVDKSLEIRPDVPGTCAWLVGVAFLLSARRAGAGRRRYALAGLAFGLGLMFTPKLAFGVVGACLGALAATRGQMFAGLLVAALASLAPLALTVAALAAKGAAGAFVQHVIVGPLGWPREASPWRFTRELFETSTFVAAAGLAGLALWLAPRRGRAVAALDPPDEARVARFTLAGAAAAITAGWFVVPVPWPQFLLPLLPLLALGAADALVRGTEKLAATLMERPGVELALAGVAVVGAIALGLHGERTHHPDRRVFAALFGLVGLCVVLAPRGARLRYAVLLVALAAPLARVVSRALWRDTELRAEFALIHAETAPTDTVLTGWFGAAVFRPHAYRYAFLHDGVLATLTPAQMGEDVLDVLRERPPAAAIRDDATRKLSAEVNSWLDTHYTPSGVGPVWLRRP